MENVERIVTAAAVSPNEENVDRALRPTLLSEYVGQELVRDQLSIFSAAASRSTICCSLGLRASEKRRLPTSWQTKWE
jgi:hypothetical protein